MPTAPGSYVTVTTAPPSPNGNAATGTWFVTGQTVQGPVGVAVPISSLSDFTNYFGPRVATNTNGTLLYDSLDEFFHDGGVLAYVSRVPGASAAYASVTLNDITTPVPGTSLKITACGPGAWASTGSNGALAVTVAAGSASNSYTLTVKYNGVQVGQTSPNLFTPADAVTWYASQPSWQTYITVSLPSGASGVIPATGSFSLTGGSDGMTAQEQAWTTALVPFVDTLGPGQVSAPGHTSTAGYQALATHAYTFNRVAILDVADSASAGTLVGQAQAVQNSSTALVPDASFCAMFAPWIIIPGISSTAPGASSPVPNRLCPPSALAAACMANNDRYNDANKAAAGTNGQSNFAIGVSNVYINSDRDTLNAAGVDVILKQNNVTTVYGYRSLATDPNWVPLTYVRFRMQMVNDFNSIANGFVFGEIDGKGQLFSQLNGALAGRCQQYWLNNSLYGVNPADSFTINTGPQVNTPTTIASGQINAQVLVRLSPTAEIVTITVVKYLSNSSLPTI